MHRPFDPASQTAEQRRRGSSATTTTSSATFRSTGPSEHGLLVVNHEYTNEELMFPGIGGQDKDGQASPSMTTGARRIEMMAHGGSVLEVKKKAASGLSSDGSKYARRITAETEMAISGPAAGHARMKTKADPTGTKRQGHAQQLRRRA